MDTKELADYVDNNRWLLNSGLITDVTKNNLFMYGTLTHKDVRAVELELDVVGKLVKYYVYTTKSLIKKIAKFDKLSKATSLFGMWRFARFLRKEGDLNISKILSNFVKDLCGPSWNTEVIIRDYDEYENGFQVQEDDPDGLLPSESTNTVPNQG